MSKKYSLIIILFLFYGCSLIPFPKINSPKPPDTIYDYEETTLSSPQAIITDGKAYVVENKERKLIVNYSQKEKKLSFLEKIGNWISSLSLIAFILIIAGLFLAPSATIAFLLGLLKKWKNAFKETARAIQESKAIETNPELKNALKDKQSESTKAIVDKIQRSEL